MCVTNSELSHAPHVAFRVVSLIWPCPSDDPLLRGHGQSSASFLRGSDGEETIVTFREVLAHAIAWLQQDKRISYRALKRQFALDDDYLADLKDELIEIQQVAVDQRLRSAPAGRCMTSGITRVSLYGARQRG
jgi:hypothetical protein